ncbi:DinB family protein [Abyssalbus ytuae]|uniref:DinB family protein n=1 Tax=Abyssalbus ytuae TaxID=2926907 RepID=A0A9E7CSE5_9FLAO|nr:DinB family protein [Abyssalbus ytuae]UOB16151.1 DinB family protein [Abyssalbus ytuae]
MKFFFEYNWKIRNEWFNLLKNVPQDELLKERTGGLGSISKTLFHIIKVEHNWICDLKGMPILDIKFSSSFTGLHSIINFSNELNKDVVEYLSNWNDNYEYKILYLKPENGGDIRCTYAEVLRHLIIHEIHHIGQLSIWVRELGMKPVSSNFIHNGLMKN